jgi:hypothetical protein
MRPEPSGFHPHGCFFGGPEGEGFWFAVDGCPLDHSDGDIPPLVGTEEGVRAAWEHLRLAGLLRSDEST